jgi:hypothetical protein
MPPDKPSHEPDANRESAPQLGQHELARLIAATRQPTVLPAIILDIRDEFDDKAYS